MLTSNPFYQLITRIQEKKQLILGYEITLAETTEGSSYYRLTSKKPFQGFLIGEFIFDEAHVSIYDQYDKTNPVLSLYHITARFRHSNTKQTYRLHVYFDKQNQLTTLPAYHEEYAPGQFRFISVSSDDADLFLQTALLSMQPIISALHTEQTQIIDTLTDSYKKEEQQLSLLSKDFITNKDKMLALITSLRRTLLELSQLGDDEQRSFAVSTLKYFDRYEQHILSAQSDLASDPAPTEDVSEAETLTPILPYKKTPPLLVADPLGHIDDIESRLQRLKNDSTTLSDPSFLTDEQIVLLNELRNKGLLLKAEILDQKTEHRRLMACLIRLNAFISDLDVIGKKQLDHACLSSTTIDQLRCLPLNGFYHLIDKRMLRYALQRRKHELLAFLLEQCPHLRATMQHQSLKIGKETYPTAVHYCFSHSTQTNMDLCLSILIQYGATLHVSPSTNTPPFSHELLSNIAHPLIGAINKNTIKAFDKTFFHHLMVHLQYYIAQNQSRLTPQDSVILQKYLAIYKAQCISIGRQSTSTTLLSHELIKSIHDNIGSDVIILLNEDAQIDALKKTRDSAYQALMKKLSPSQRRVLQRQQAEYMKKMQEIMTSPMSKGGIDYNSLQTATKNYLEKSIKWIELNSELLLVNETIIEKGPLVGRAHASKERRQLVNESNKLFLAIVQLNKELAISDEDLVIVERTHQLENLTLKLKKLTQCLEVLENFSSSLGVLVAELGAASMESAQNRISVEKKPEHSDDSSDCTKMNFP